MSVALSEEEKATKELRKHGFYVAYDEDSNNIVVTGTVKGAVAVGERLLKKDASLCRNVESCSEPLVNTDTAFHGVEADVLINKDLRGKKDMKPLQEARKKLVRAGVVTAIQQSAWQNIPRRRRIKSEHDGDWVYDRQWDHTPYDATSRRNTATRGVRLHAMFCANGGISSESLDSYGALVWALTDLLEASGINVTLEINFSSDDVSSKHEAGTVITLTVKEPNQYASPAMIAACFQTAFFRRIDFSLEHVVCQVIGDKASYGLGRAVYPDEAVEYKDGVLVLGPSAADVSDERLLKELLKALGINKEV